MGARLGAPFSLEVVVSRFVLSYRSGDNVYRTRGSLASIGDTYADDSSFNVSELKEFFTDRFGAGNFVLTRSGVKYPPVLTHNSKDVYLTPDGLVLAKFKPNSTFRRVVSMGFDGADPAELFEVMYIISDFPYMGESDRELFNVFVDSILVVENSKVWLVEVPSV